MTATSPGHVLTQQEIDAFVRDGFVIARNAFRRETAEQLLAYIWAHLPEKPDAPDTWTRPSAEIQEDTGRPLPGYTHPVFRAP